MVYLRGVYLKLSYHDGERPMKNEIITVPSGSILKNELWVVAKWKYDFFSFGKNVSGFQSLSKYLENQNQP